VEVRAAVAPSVQVHPADLAEGEDGALDPGSERPECSRRFGREVLERVHMLAAGEPDDAGEAAADGRVQREVLVPPDRGRRPAVADAAWLTTRLATARWLGVTGLASGRFNGSKGSSIRAL
jgi:hypothetical protein